MIKIPSKASIEVFRVSFPKAIKLPVKVIPPIAKVKITKEFCNIFSILLKSQEVEIERKNCLKSMSRGILTRKASENEFLMDLMPSWLDLPMALWTG